MREQSSPDDPRTRRSRDRMIVALRDVAREGDPTVPAVSSAAGVTRATFYNHFVSLEEAAWFAMSDSFDQLLTQDSAARHQGDTPGLVGVASLRKIVELLRVDGELVRLADSYRAQSVLPGLVNIVLGQVRHFRDEFGGPATADAAAEDVYIAAGLYALLLTGSRGDQDAADVASVAYSLLPEWMRQPRSI